MKYILSHSEVEEIACADEDMDLARMDDLVMSDRALRDLLKRARMCLSDRNIYLDQTLLDDIREALW